MADRLGNELMNSDPLQDEIYFDGKVTSEIFLRLQYLHLGRRKYMVFLTIPLAMILLGFRIQDLELFIMTFITSLVVAVIMLWWQKWSFLRTYKRSSHLHESLKGSVSPFGLKVESRTGQSNLQWNDFIKSKYSDELILLYRTCLQFKEKSFLLGEWDIQQM